MLYAAASLSTDEDSSHRASAGGRESNCEVGLPIRRYRDRGRPRRSGREGGLRIGRCALVPDAIDGYHDDRVDTGAVGIPRRVCVLRTGQNPY